MASGRPRIDPTPTFLAQLSRIRWHRSAEPQLAYVICRGAALPARLPGNLNHLRGHNFIAVDEIGLSERPGP